MGATVSYHDSKYLNGNNIMWMTASLDTACCRYSYNRNKFYKFDDQEVSEISTNKLQVRLSYYGCVTNIIVLFSCA